MCVWCAYSGKRQAADVLIECGERIEGLWSGFYTGLVTCDDRGMHCKDIYIIVQMRNIKSNRKCTIKRINRWFG